MITIKTQSHVGQRIAATIIDYFFIFGFSFVIVYFFGVTDENGDQVLEGPIALVPMLFWFCWLVIPETIWGKTLGHHVTGLKVITTKGDKILFRQALVRRLFDILDFYICFPGLLAFILVQTTKDNQRLGDLVAKTLVVEKNLERQETVFDFENSIHNQ